MARTDLSFRHRFISSMNKAAPVLLLLHGTGGNESDLIPVGQELAQALPGGAHLLSPRGKVLENGMPRFFRRLAEGVFDIEDLKRRSDELARFVEAAGRAYGFDTRKVIAAGYSNGANIAAATLLLHPGVLAGGVLLRPMVPFEPEAKPDLSGVSIFIAGGQHDPIVPADQARRLAVLLQSAGADVELYWHSGGHELSEAELAAAAAWLSRLPAQRSWAVVE
jgi:phospholipase/carboxylesterase